MRRNKIFLWALLATVLFTTAALATGSAAASVGGPKADSGVVLSGGRYALANGTARGAWVNANPQYVLASGGGYNLVGPSPQAGGSCCSCTFIPCIKK